MTKSGVVGAGGAVAAAGDWSGAGYVLDSGAGSATLNADNTTAPALKLYYKRTLVNLTVNPDGGTGGTASQTGLRWGQEVALTNPARAGYTFSHWSVTAGTGAGIAADGKLIMGTTNTTIEAVWTENGGQGADHSGCKPFGKCKVTGECALFTCKMPSWLSPFLHVGSFLLGFGAGWVTRAATMPWWVILLLCILGLLLFPLFWWIIL